MRKLFLLISIFNFLACSSESSNIEARLIEVKPCNKLDSGNITCAKLQVPLDYDNKNGDTLLLDVAFTNSENKDKGTLLVLTGGPGQEGTSFIHRFSKSLGAVDNRYQIVMIDQRGTGNNAIACPMLQNETGSSDVIAASSEAIDECANLLKGNREFYSSWHTVRDLEQLRKALHLDDWSISGTSYGSFVAGLYALEYPNNVKKVVMDSIVPTYGFDLSLLSSVKRVSELIHETCEKDPSCTEDPLSNLQQLFKQGYDEVSVLDMLVGEISIFGTPLHELVRIINKAARGDDLEFSELVTRSIELASAPLKSFSSGLHQATLCIDHQMPWGDSTTPVKDRMPALQAFVESIPQEEVYPFSREVLIRQGGFSNCLTWPETRSATPTHKRHISQKVSVLLINGENDTSTPVSEVELQAKVTPNNRIAIIPGAGHSVTSSTLEGLQIMRDFLLE